YHIPSGRHADAAALAVLADVLGDTPGGRLHKTLVEPGLATMAAAMDLALAEPGYLLVLAQAPKGSDLAVLERTLLAQLETIAERPIGDDEVADARRRLAKNIDLTINDANRLAM